MLCDGYVVCYFGLVNLLLLYVIFLFGDLCYEVCGKVVCVCFEWLIVMLFVVGGLYGMVLLVEW